MGHKVPIPIHQKDLEALALSYDGVETTYAIQAAGEMRVIVATENVNIARAEQLAFDISQCF